MGFKKNCIQFFKMWKYTIDLLCLHLFVYIELMWHAVQRILGYFQCWNKYSLLTLKLFKKLQGKAVYNENFIQLPRKTQVNRIFVQCSFPVRRNTQMDPNEPKWTQMEPKWTQMEIKWTQMEIKSTQMEIKWKYKYFLLTWMKY